MLHFTNMYVIMGILPSHNSTKPASEDCRQYSLTICLTLTLAKDARALSQKHDEGNDYATYLTSSNSGTHSRIIHTCWCLLIRCSSSSITTGTLEPSHATWCPPTLGSVTRLRHLALHLANTKNTRCMSQQYQNAAENCPVPST